MSRLFVRCLSGLLLACLLTIGPARGAGNVDAARAFTLADVDLQRSAIINKGQREPLTAAAFRAHFDPIVDKPVRNEVQATEGWQLVLVFRKPTPLGTALLSTCGGPSGNFLAQTLQPGFTGSPDKPKPTDWQTISSTHTFPADFKTQAVRLQATREYRGPLAWLFWQPRLASITAAAVGSGERAPFGAHPDALPRSEAWFNTSRDMRPGAAKQMQRGPVSEALPSFYILSWDTPQALTGLWLSCNADKYRLFAYRGAEGLNPAVAPESAWKHIDAQVLHQQAGGGERAIDRLLMFPPLQTVAIKLEMTSCQRGPVAWIGQMAALVNDQSAGKAAIAANAPAMTGSKAISFEQPFDGQLALVITDQEGRTIRNLVAQVDRKKGSNTESWDLKDEMGLAVAPGKYRWKAITSPPLGLRYQMTVYPNTPQIFPGMTPWLNGESGANGWLADHASITSGATCGDRLYFGSPGVEGGVSLIECNLEGRKQWGKHSFGPFSGVGCLTADNRYVYIQERDSLHRLDPKTHQIERLAALSSVERQGTLVGFAAHDGKVAISLTSPVPWLENATRSEVVDMEHCLPKFAERIPDPLGTRRVQPNPRVDFLRLLRLTGQPAGQGQVSPDRRESIFPITIDTAGGDKKYQYVVLAFREPVPLGSVVLPCVGPEYQVEMSVLKADAPYPPNPRQEANWQLCPEQPKPGWTCIPMPPETRTRGLRLRVRLAKDAAEDNLIDDLLTKDASKDPLEIDLDKPAKTGEGKLGAEAKAAPGWFARFEGMKLLRRRFTNVTPQAEVRVNSGEVNASGEWDAQRTEALSPENPGVYVLEWKEPQKLAGLAIKEIDGALTEIDVWDDATASSVPLTDATGWRQVAKYEQARRDSYEPAFERNDCAMYLDGYVPFGGEITTRAVRLRVVSQWADNSQRGTASLRRDHGGRTLDPRRCRVWGVAALQYLGEEAPLDTLSAQRLEVRDGQTGKVISETTVKLAENDKADSKQSPVGPAVPVSLAYRADGALFAVMQGQIVQINPESGAATSILPEIDGQSTIAHRLAIGADGLFYVAVHPEQVIHVYDPQGKKLRTIGHAGGQQVGPWDPEKFNQIETLVVDNSGQLWVVESQDIPRRIVQYDAKGKFVREFYGNTHYGGGGVLDPADKARLFYHHIEFAIDWKTGHSRIKNKMAPWMPENCVPVRYQGHTYLTTTPLSHSASQQVGVVYRYDEAKGVTALAAAFGEANAFDQLKTPGILKLLAEGKVPKDYTFLWADVNGDGEVNPHEVTLELKPPQMGGLQLGRFTSALHCWAGSQMYQPKSVLKNGTPVFEKIESPSPRVGLYELNNGDVLAFGMPSQRRVRHGDGLGQETQAIDKTGHVRWSYPTEHQSVSGLWLPPYEPGYVSNEFAVIGHATAKAGDLGEYVIVHGNNGQWKIWTADGLLAGQILRHKFDPRSTVETSLASVQRDTPLDNLTAGQEHFHGYFTQTPDGKDYIVHGHNFIMITEVLGLDKFRRLEGEVVVSTDDARRVRQRQEELARREAKSQARILECLLVKDGQVVEVAELDGAKFGMGYDNENLYVRWSVTGLGQLSNSGTDFHRYFKTGACLDLQLGIDGQAAAGRKGPVAGDLRMLFTVAEGKLQAVLYQPIAADASPNEAWETRTDAGGTTKFDRVIRLTDAKLNFKADGDNQFTFTAAIPLRSLGWKPVDGQLLRCDWGVLASDDGHTVQRRFYWSNTLATGTTDEAWEARLDPHLWGTLAVTTATRDERQLEKAAPNGKNKGRNATDDLLDEIELKKK